MPGTSLAQFEVMGDRCAARRACSRPYVESALVAVMVCLVCFEELWDGHCEKILVSGVGD
jgi:hypothetical protein